MPDYDFKIISPIATISTSGSGWTKEVNLVSWNGIPAKFDLRDWGLNHSSVSKGMTLIEDEYKMLKDVLIPDTDHGKGANLYTFVEREEVIPAMSERVIEIEFSRKSGTMYTADSGVENGRKIIYYMPRNFELRECDENVDMVERKGDIPLYDT